MDALLVTAGALIVLVTLADLFFTVLYPGSGHGPVRKPLTAALWRLFHLASRVSGPRGRRSLVSYAGPVVIGATLVAWFVLLNAGFAMIFKPGLGSGVVASPGPTDTGWVAALYYSGFSLTTLGVGDLAPKSSAHRMLTVVAAGLGFSYFSMGITYFLSVYAHLTSRNAFAQSLHHLTGRTGDAAELIVRIAEGEDLDSAGQHLSSKATFLRGIYQSHSFYPVLRQFQYQEAHYALPRILLIALDTSALLRTALDPVRYQRVQRSASLLTLDEAADDLMQSLGARQEARTPTGEEAALWSGRYRAAHARLAEAGLRARSDREQGAQEYVELRARWDRSLRELVSTMLYDWDFIGGLAEDGRSRSA
jgi:hypothetical protein